MVQLFNLTGKIARQKRETVVGLLYREPELAKAILNCRTYEDLHLYKRAQRLAFDEFILEEFLTSRELFLPGTTHAGRNSYLVPVVDCINHHSGAVGIIPASKGSGAQASWSTTAVPGRRAPNATFSTGIMTLQTASCFIISSTGMPDLSGPFR